MLYGDKKKSDKSVQKWSARVDDEEIVAIEYGKSSCLWRSGGGVGY